MEDKTLKEMIFAADLDEDGKVSKDEFMRVMRKMKLIWSKWRFTIIYFTNFIKKNFYFTLKKLQ